ncbi:MAG: DUF1570 domain-containing protein [Sphingomonas sp.]|jgi:tetratricopeptide (TPR) repeat protein|uniref:DUF1570 domain-containing protein n=1 Tax=Sphingomonas sp. TaxID=28214 RepID=UPI0035696D36
MFRKLLLAGVLCLAPSLAHAEWQQGKSEHFLVYADDSPEKVKATTAQLERFDRAVRVALNLRDREVGSNARVIVFVLPSMADVQKMLGMKNSNVGGYYRGSYPSGPFAFVPAQSPSDSSGMLSPRTVLQHEYTHHLMYSSWGDVVFPTWFSEGFAELFATAKTLRDGGVVIGAGPTYRMYGMSRMNDLPVEQLVAGRPDYRDAMQMQIFYGRSWLLTHYLMFDKDRSKQLAAYIAAINEGKPAKEAEAALGLTSSLDLKLNAYGARKGLPATELSASELPIGEVTTRPLTPGEAAVMPAMMRSYNGVDQKLAKEVVAQARQLAAPYPNDAGAQNALAEAEFDAGNLAEANAAADRALAADPKSVHALIYKGMAQMAIAKKAENKDPAVWTVARRWFLAANKIDPLYSWPPQLYYESFGQAGQGAPKSARDAMLYAYKLSPQNIGLRLQASRVLLQDGETKAARVALEPIAYSPHGGDLADQAKRMIAALDSGGTAVALAVLQADAAKAKKEAEDAKAKPADKKN